MHPDQLNEDQRAAWRALIQEEIAKDRRAQIDAKIEYWRKKSQSREAPSS